MSDKFECFKAYDVRGRVPDQINEDIAYRIGRAYADVVSPGKVVVGHDVRLTSAALKMALANGLRDGGVDVFDIGLCGTEEIYFAASHASVGGEKMGGGIVVTASHNPKDYNGMKFVREESKPISGDTGLFDIQRIAEQNSFAAVDKRGEYAEIDTAPAYVQHLLSYIDLKKLKPLKIVVDAGNGGAGLVIDRAVADGLHRPGVSVPCTALVRGDALEPCISAASILAKVARDAKESDVRWAAINRMTNSDVLMKVARQNNGWDGYLNAAAVERLNDQAALFQLACDATNWPGLWTVRNHATSKLTDQKALAMVACEEHEPQICRTAVRGLTNQDLLVKVLLHGGDFWAVRKQSFNKLDLVHLTSLVTETKDPAQVIAARIKLGELNWDQAFTPESLNTNGLGNVVGAAALVNRPQPGTNAVLTICHRLVTQDPSTRWPELVDLLNRFGDRALAEDYVNSSERELQFFGARWADNHGYRQAGGLYPSSKRIRLVANDK